jgi:hypothetical protein
MSSQTERKVKFKLDGNLTPNDAEWLGLESLSGQEWIVLSWSVVTHVVPMAGGSIALFVKDTEVGRLKVSGIL